MEKHGSETFFVLGEGLLGETVGGREPRLAADAVADTPPFRFSRMGPNGAERQLTESNLKRLGNAIAAGGGGASQIPAGFTYLGQFIDHDLTFDVTNVTFGEHVSPSELLQARSPSLDLDSLYGAGPQDPDSAKFYAADGLHLKMGKTVAVGIDAAMDGFDLPRGEGSTAAQKRKAIIPDPRNDENLAVAQTHLAFIRFHNRVVDTLPASVPQSLRFAKARELVTKHYQWMIRTDYLPRICAPGVVNNVFTGGRKAFEPGAPPTQVPTMPIEFSVAAFRLGHSMIRKDLRVERPLRQRHGHPGHARPPVHLLGWQRTARRRAAAAEQLDRRLSPPVRLRGGQQARPRRPGEQVQPGDADRHPPGGPVEGPARVCRRRGQPRVSQPDPGEDGEPGHRPADGHVPEEQGRDADQAHQRPDPRRQQRRHARRAHPGAARRAAHKTPRCGSTSCARPSSTRAG